MCPPAKGEEVALSCDCDYTSVVRPSLQRRSLEQLLLHPGGEGEGGRLPGRDGGGSARESEREMLGDKLRCWRSEEPRPPPQPRPQPPLLLLLVAAAAPISEDGG